MMGVFKKIWEDQWSSRMEYILNNTILALLDNQGSTLLGINRMLSDADYRKRIVSNVTDPVVKQFWLREFASYNEKYAQEAVAPIQNKIGQFLSASVIRNIVAQVKSSINIREIMDSGKIFIVNLSKGRIGEDSSRLLGGLLITKLQLSAMERVDMQEKDRLDFYLYVDEFQNFAVDSFAGILSEARKYRLCLTIAHQYIAQLTDEVREAVFGNVGTIISFRVGSPDAKYMETEFAPRFLPEDIINLPKYNVYLKLLINGVTSQPFSAITLPPISQKTDSEERVIRVSRERYAKERSFIENQILTWSGMGDMDVDTMLAEAEEKKKSDKVAAKDAKKPKFEYDCSRCAKKMVLPVELDRSRPIYCEDCIEIVREEKNNRAGKGGGKPADTRNLPPKVLPKEAPPRAINEGKEMEDRRLPDEPTISLSTLMPKGVEEKKEVIEQKKVEPTPAPAVQKIEPVLIPPAGSHRVSVAEPQKAPVIAPKQAVESPKIMESIVRVEQKPIVTESRITFDQPVKHVEVQQTESRSATIEKTPPTTSEQPRVVPQPVRSMGNLSRTPAQASNEFSSTGLITPTREGEKRKRKRKRKKKTGDSSVNRESITVQLSQPGQTISLKSLQEQKRPEWTEQSRKEQTSVVTKLVEKTVEQSIEQPVAKTVEPIVNKQTSVVIKQVEKTVEQPTEQPVAKSVEPVVQKPIEQSTSGKLYIGQSIKFE
jgi:DNA-directed RNA polymerase subunit RPC12/RpoP